jgi:hypothetical protein
VGVRLVIACETMPTVLVWGLGVFLWVGALRVLAIALAILRDVFL